MPCVKTAGWNGRRPVIGRGVPDQASRNMMPAVLVRPGGKETDHRPPAGVFA